MRYPDGKAKAVTFCYDDGVPEARPQVSEFVRPKKTVLFRFCLYAIIK